MSGNNDNENSNAKPELPTGKPDLDSLKPNLDISDSLEPNLDVVAPEFTIVTESFDPSRLSNHKKFSD